MSDQSSTNSISNLDPQKIVDTINRLNQRIDQRFPDAGLGRVCKRLSEISENMKLRAEWIGRPVYWLRIVTWSLCVTIVVVAVVSIMLFFGSSGAEELANQGEDLPGFIQLVESSINDAVLIGAAMFFFLTLETRYKRQRALKAIHELRTVAHIIDMHQLTKDPHRFNSRNQIYASTSLSPKMTMTRFQLRRYLDYCSELLALTGKIAAVYVQKFDDGVALASVSELETLTSGLSNKIWQKIFILDAHSDEDEELSRIQSS